MLHILWMLLKLILILLGIILGLVLLVILLVLFCPVRYYASAVKDCDDFKQIKARVSISWLFHGVWVRLFFENGALRHDIRLLGFSISGLINRKKGQETKQQSSGKKTKESNSIEEKTAKKEESISKKEESFLNTEEDDEKNIETEIKTQYTEVESNSSEETASIKPLEKLENKIADVWRKLAALPKKISETIEKISLTIKTIYAKIDWWKQFLTHPRVKNAMFLAKDELFRLLRHIFPTRLWGNLTFGSEDPATTGTVLAILGATMPFHKNCIEINPVFEERNIIEGTVQLKGRIYGIVFLIAAIKIYFNKNVKYVIRRWKHKEV